MKHRNKNKQSGQALIEACIALIALPSLVIGILSAMLGFGLVQTANFTLHEFLICDSSINNYKCKSSADSRMGALIPLVRNFDLKVQRTFNKTQGILKFDTLYGSHHEITQVLEK